MTNSHTLLPWLVLVAFGGIFGLNRAEAAPGDLTTIVINVPPHQIVGQPLVGQSSLLLLDENGTLLTDYNLSANPITLSCSVGQLSPNQISDSTLFVGGVIDLTGLNIRYDGPSGAAAVTASSTGISSSAVLVSFSGYDIIGVPGLIADTVSQLYQDVATDLSVIVSNGGDQVAIADPDVKAHFMSGGGSISVFFDPRSNGRPDTIRVELPTADLAPGEDTLVLVLESSYRPNGATVDVRDTLRIPVIVADGEDLHIIPASFEPDSVYAGIPFEATFLVSTGGIQQPWDGASLELVMLSDADSVLAIIFSAEVVHTDISQDTLVYGGVTMQVPPVFMPGTYRTRADYFLTAGALRFGSQSPYLDTLTVLPAPSITYQTGTLSPTAVISEQESDFQFDILLDGTEPVLVSSADSYFELRLDEFSASVGLVITGNVLYPGLNRVFTRPLFVSDALVNQSLEAAAMIYYSHEGSSNRLSFSTDFDGRTIFVEATPKVKVVMAEAEAPNSPLVNTGQVFQVHARVENVSPTAISPFDLRLVTDGLSQYDTLVTVPGIPGYDTADAYFSVIAASTPNPIEIFRVDIADPEIVRETPSDNIAFVTVQRPAELSVSLILRGADEGYVEVGAGFDLLLRILNTGEAKATSGTFHISTNGMDLGLPGGVTEVDESVVVGEIRGVTFTAPPVDTIIVLDVVLTQIPADENTKSAAIIGDTAFHLEVVVAASEINLQAATVEVPSNVLLPDSRRDLVILQLSNPATSSVSDIRVLSLVADLVDRDGRPLAPGSVILIDSTRFLVDGLVVAEASVVADRLVMTFADLVVAAGDTIDLVLNTTTAGTGASEFSLRLKASDIEACYSAGPLQGVPVTVATDNASGLVTNEVFTLVERTLDGSFVVRTNPFNPLNEPAEFRYYLDGGSNLTMVVLTLTGETVSRRDLMAGEPGASAGENVLFWDGRNDAGNVVDNGVYLVVISLGENGPRATLKLAVVK